MLDSKILKKTKSLFMIYANFESIFVSADNKKQNLNESYTNKYQKHVASGYGHRLTGVDNKFSKALKSYFGGDAVYTFINSIIEENISCNDVMKKHFSKELVMSKTGDENFNNSTKCWVCDNDYVHGDMKVRVIIISSEKIETLHIEIRISKFITK